MSRWITTTVTKADAVASAARWKGPRWLWNRRQRIMAVLSWEDAVVCRSSELKRALMQFYPPMTGYGSAGGFTCQCCSAWFDSNGNPAGAGHASFCSATRIERIFAAMTPAALDPERSEANRD